MMFAEYRAENSPFLDIDLGRHNQGEKLLGTRPFSSCKVCTALVKEMLQTWELSRKRSRIRVQGWDTWSIWWLQELSMIFPHAQHGSLIPNMCGWAKNYLDGPDIYTRMIITQL